MSGQFQSTGSAPSTLSRNLRGETRVPNPSYRRSKAATGSVGTGNLPTSLKIRFRFAGKCSLHPRYNPARDGGPEHGECEDSESVYVIDPYVRIAERRAEN